MTLERRTKLWEAFDRAAELTGDQRAAFLEEACAGDAEMRAEVESLLAHDDSSEQGSARFLESPLIRLPADSTVSAAQPGLPERVGRYRIVRWLSEGGMGAVYEAEQDSPRRVVALKVIRPEVISPTTIKRFAQEAQILGRLHHPGIAQIYEAGMAEDGRPFFAMEFIEGLPLTDFARQERLDLAGRLRLMVEVCSAVQHAHDFGFIHRDLKPGNILVNLAGQPKVLDFGVARAVDADLLTMASRTQAGELLGTLSYMSPEQVGGEGAALDARSDVYALGVILFELLAGRLPYHLENLPLPEVARIIREQEPSRLGLVQSAFRGDVETIANKALEKDRARRYESAADLSADLRRYLSHEPILARPPSALYQLRKFTRRHKALVGGVAGVFAALLAGTIVSFSFALNAWQNAQLAQEEKHQATYQAYRARIAAAVAAMANNDVAEAGRQLEAAPADLRDWEWRHLTSRLDDSVAVVRLPVGDGALLLPDPKRVLVGLFSDTGLHFRDESGNASPERPFPNLAKEMLSVVGPSTDWWVAAARTLTDVYEVRLHDSTGRLVRRIGTRAQVVGRLALSPDRSRLAVTLFTNRAVAAVYDTSSGRQVASWDGTPGINALAFSPDNRRLATGGDDRVVHIWDVATGKQLTQCQGHTSKILSITFRSDGLRLLTASHDGSVRQWDAQTGREVESPYERHTAEVAAAVYSPDGQRVASAGLDRTVRLWRASGRQDQAVLRGHFGAVSELVFSQDGRRLVSASYNQPNLAGDSTLRFWETSPDVTLPILAGHASYVYPVAYSPDGRWIASGSWDKTARLWDAATGELCATLPHPDIMRTLAFTPDGARLLTAGVEVLIWNVSTGRIQGRISYLKDVVSLAVSPDGTRIAAGTYEPKVGLRMSITDFATGREIASSDGMPIAFSPDGKWLAGTDTSKRDIALWDAHTFRRAATFQGHTKEINSIAFDREGGQLASASNDHTVRLWDVATGQCLHVFEGHTEDVFAVAFHPGGTRLASAGRDRAIWLWDLARGEEVTRLPGHTSYVWSLVFSPDGKTLVSGSGDSTVRLWDTEPLSKRYQARREAESHRSKAETLKGPIE
jgi:eukaryotic-like serine/threonine-protein kinase